MHKGPMLRVGKKLASNRQRVTQERVEDAGPGWNVPGRNRRVRRDANVAADQSGSSASCDPHRASQFPAVRYSRRRRDPVQWMPTERGRARRRILVRVDLVAPGIPDLQHALVLRCTVLAVQRVRHGPDPNFAPNGLVMSRERDFPDTPLIAELISLPIRWESMALRWRLRWQLRWLHSRGRRMCRCGLSPSTCLT